MGRPRSRKSGKLRQYLRHIPFDIILVYLFINIAMALGGRLYVYRFTERTKYQKSDELNAIAILKSKQISDWRQDLMNNSKHFTASWLHSEMLERLLKNANTPQAKKEFIELAHQINSERNYRYIALLNEKRETVLSAPETPVQLSPFLQSLISESFQAGLPMISDLFREPDGRTYMALINPVSNLGSLLLLIDPSDFLYPLILQWPTRSPTAETLLVRREGDQVLFLNELRHRKGTALALSLPLSRSDLPAVMAVLGRRGIVEGVDYRGVPVLACLQRVPGTPWSLVAKVDQEEIYAPIREISRLFLIFISAFAAASTCFLVLRLKRLFLLNARERAALVSHYGYLARYANDIILLLDKRWRIIEANDQAVAAYGHSREHLASLRLQDLSLPDADDHWETISRQLKGEKGIILESLHRRRDGSTFPVESSMRAIEVQDQSYIQCIIRDISERKRAEEEKRKLEGQLQQLQKLEAIGQLAGGIAHDFNNILTAILGYTEYIKMKMPADEPLRNAVQGIHTATGRAARLTHGLLAFSEQQRLTWEVLDLNEVIRRQRQSLAQLMGEGIEVGLELHPQNLLVRADSDQIAHVLANLASNARDAMPEGGRFTIQTVPAPPEFGATGAGEQAGQPSYVRLTVADTGTGMDEATLERIFEPFFTTKEFGRGAGMGLPIVYGIVHQHNGHIDVTSVQGQGTVFKIYFPTIKAA